MGWTEKFGCKAEQREALEVNNPVWLFDQPLIDWYKIMPNKIWKRWTDPPYIVN